MTFLKYGSASSSGQQTLKHYIPWLAVCLGILSGCTTVTPPCCEQPQQKEASAEDKLHELVASDPLFAMMAAEIASQRGETPTAVAAYTVAAEDLKDPELARRAVELALADQKPELALEAARIWSKLSPDNQEASRTVLLLLLSTNRVDEAMPAMQGMLERLKAAEKAHPGVGAAGPMKVALELLLRIENKEAAYQAGLKLLGNDLKDTEVQYVLSQLAFSADKPGLAAEHLQNVIDLVPEERYYLLQAQYYQSRDGNDEAATALLRGLAQRHSNWFSTRLYLARIYTQNNNWQGAVELFAQLIALQPNNYPLYSSQGFVLANLKDAAEAERHFRIYLKHTEPAERKNELLIHLTMAELFNEKKNFKKAIEWLKNAPNAGESVDVQLVLHKLYKDQKDTKLATKVLESFKPQNEDDAVRIALALAKWREELKNPPAAIDALEKGLQAYPDQPDLLYERAMVAERQSDLDSVERYLKRLITVKPDNPHGYNALGYTWADNNVRLPEALDLIRKANDLAPNDPYILDSLGWVYFRMGDDVKAVSTLEQAYTIKQDQEIGLHLIEVYMAQGRREDALRVYGELKAKYPDSSELRAMNEKLSNI